MYKSHQKLYNMTIGNLKWEDFCFKVPIIQPDLTCIFDRKRRKRQDEFDDFEDMLIDDVNDISDPSVGDHYPRPYCNCVESK